MTHRVGPKGQVVIPKALREELGIEPGDEVSFWRHDDHVALRPTRSRRPLRAGSQGRLLRRFWKGSGERTAAGSSARDGGSRLLGDTSLPRGRRARGHLGRGSFFEQELPVVSWINLGEVFYVVCRLHGDHAAAEAVRDLRDSTDAELPVETRIIEAARIKAEHSLAYGTLSLPRRRSPTTPSCGRAILSCWWTGPDGGGGICVPEHSRCRLASRGDVSSGAQAFAVDGNEPFYTRRQGQQEGKRPPRRRSPSR